MNSVRPLLVLTACCLSAPPTSAQDRFEAVRHRMVATVIEAEGIKDPAVLAAMKMVPRHEFVSGTHRSRAYEDLALPIGSKQTISPPYIVAYMTETLAPQKTDRVLEIGTGSGYQAAVLSHIVKDVYSIEIVDALAKSAKRRLEKLGYRNIHTKAGDGYLGWPEHAPFDKIIVTCSPENVPEPLIDQLREGGQMIIPLGERYQQSFYLLEKKDGKLVQERLVSTLFVPMTGESENLRRVQPNPNNPQIANADFELDTNEDEKVDGWHYQRQTEHSTDTPMKGSHLIRFSNETPGELSQALQGVAINGRKIGGLRTAVWARTNSIVSGAGATDKAALVVHFYDAVRREVGTVIVQQWMGTSNWQQYKRTIPVPPTAREMIVRIGLNGAIGVLDLDDLQMIPLAR
ncbi:MAG: protein-L-isoaspartate(D-aspartate) O-methyltransferase [Planctomycetaceae bacterium]|nr:protein-L-isoaspartate(D-aspartate) O-methyltransferase [Planctomycetaceae bacterium]